MNEASEVYLRLLSDSIYIDDCKVYFDKHIKYKGVDVEACVFSFVYNFGYIGYSQNIISTCQTKGCITPHHLKIEGVDKNHMYYYNRKHKLFNLCLKRKMFNDNGCLKPSNKKSRITNIFFENRTFKTHRVMYSCVNGFLNHGHDVHHVCKVPLCCNPAHLLEVTRDEHKEIHNAK